jgi:hypothetical protein
MLLQSNLVRSLLILIPIAFGILTGVVAGEVSAGLQTSISNLKRAEAAQGNNASDIASAATRVRAALERVTFLRQASWLLAVVLAIGVMTLKDVPLSLRVAILSATVCLALGFVIFAPLS